ncbi:HPP family-domain-containing protein, partial [Pilaira anomala]
IFTYSESFKAHKTPMIVASFGATAVLVYGVIESPLAQPRNVIGGHAIGSIVGVIIAQLFLNIQHHWASEAQKTAVTWVAGATAMALALNLMQLTKTVHPPAGASALIAVVTPDILDLSWFYIGVVVLSAVMQVAIACLINNAERRYPQYWWTPHKPIQIDPATVKTVIPQSDEKIPEDVVSTHLTAAEEGRL